MHISAPATIKYQWLLPTMIVVEDIEASEIHRFVVIDASIQLGIVRAGTYIRTFDPGRAFSYYNMVENQLHDFAAQYPGAFKYLPRRAYDYLKKPQILSEFTQGASDLSQSSWLVDFLMINPLIGFGETILPKSQQEANVESVNRWATLPPTSPRLYHLQDMRLNRRSPAGWGCMLNASDLALAIKGSNRNDLLDSIKSGKPIFIELTSPNDLDPLIEWIVLLKDAGLQDPKLILKARSQKDWGKDITRLLEIPNSILLTAGASISSLATIIRYMKKKQGDELWSKRLMFASSYPETQIGDSVSEILSFFLSRNLSASPAEIQRIIGGNMLELLPPRPPYLVYKENKNSVMAEENLGKAALNELVRILQVLAARNILNITSIDHTVEEDGGIVNLDSAVITAVEPNSERAISLSIVLEKNGAVMISGWKRAFTDSLKKRDGMMLQTLVRANAKLDGPIFASPAHLVNFDEALLKCLEVEEPRPIISALHFGIEIAKTEKGTFLMSAADMEALDVQTNDYVLALETRTGQWCAGLVKEHSKCSERSIVVSEIDASIVGFRNSSVVNIVKIEDEIPNITKLVLSYKSNKPSSNIELVSSMHLHGDEILDSLQGRYVGVESKLIAGPEVQPLTLSIRCTEPTLRGGQIGKILGEEIILKPSQSFRELNIVVCMSNGKDMSKRDIPLKSLHTSIRELDDLVRMVPEVGTFLSGLGNNPTRAEVAALSALLVVNTMSQNRTEGRFGLVTFADAPEKFSVQHGSEVRSYVEFIGDLQSEEVIVSLIFSILDSARDTGGYEQMVGAYRSIAEYLEDFGSERPTLLLVFSGNIGKYDEEHLPFTQAIKENDRYQIEFFTFDSTTNQKSALRLLKGINARVLPMDSFSSQLFIGHLLDVIDSLVPVATTQPDA
ncbi:MAG: hypothetical protein ACFFEV_05045 [Candidatus Thorarchaeota archaeon]